MGRPKGSKNKPKTGTESGTGTKKGTGTGIIKSGTGKKKTGTGKREYTMSDMALAQRRYNSGALPFTDEDAKAYNAAVIHHAMQTMEIAQQADKNDPKSLMSCFYNYMQLCEKNNMKIGNLGACASMGIELRTLFLWRDGSRRADNPEYKRLADIVTTICSMSREQLISDGKLNPVTGIFWQRNYDGLRNDTEQVQNAKDTNQGNDEIMTATEYSQKYGGLLED